MGKSNNIAYVVRSEYNEDDIHVFNSRPVLAREMTRRTGKEWVLETIHYHFTKKKEDCFSRHGWEINVCTLTGLLELLESQSDEVYILIESKKGKEVYSVYVALGGLFSDLTLDKVKVSETKEIARILKEATKYEAEKFTIYRRKLIQE